MIQRKVDLFLLGRKAETVLLRILQDHGPIVIASIVGGQDSSIEDDRFEPIKEIAHARSIPFFTRGESNQAKADTAIAVGWRWLIKRDYTPLVVLHDSLLPKYRGFNPLVSYLLNEEPQIGVTALVAVADYDRGPILAQRAVKITHPMRLADAIEAIAPLYAEIASEIVSGLASDTLQPGTPQIEADASYSLWRDEEDYHIDWQRDAAYIHRFIWALGSPYAGAKALLNDRWIRITDAEIIEDVVIENRVPGKVIFMAEGLPTVVCGSGLLRITAATYDDDKSSALPLKQFRSRFK